MDPSSPQDVAAPMGAAEDEAAAEAAAWAAVEARWDEPAAHQAYLDRGTDLDRLAAAGRRYRDALAARPGDTVALAMKGEVLKRATVVGLAMLPRTPPPRQAGGRARRIAVLVMAAWLALTLAWLIYRIFAGHAA
jgi:hypothetical protein